MQTAFNKSVSDMTCLLFQDPGHGVNQHVVPFYKVQFVAEEDEKSYNEEEHWKKQAKDGAKANSNNKHQNEVHDYGSTKKNVKYKDYYGKRVIVTEYGICGTVRYLGHPFAGSLLLCGIETVMSIFSSFNTVFSLITSGSFDRMLVQKKVFWLGINFKI